MVLFLTPAITIALGLLVGGGYVARTWRRYGKVDATLPPDPLLDRFIPEYEVREQHEGDDQAEPYEAHAEGIEVHAWIITTAIWNSAAAWAYDYFGGALAMVATLGAKARFFGGN